VASLISDCVVESFCRIAVDTEELGVSVIGELQSQRETIQRSKMRAEETQRNLETSRGALRAMDGRITTNKMVKYATAILLCAAILLLLRGKFHASKTLAI